MEKRKLKPLKDYYLSSDRWARYIPILDRDPVIAARSIPKKNIKKCYELLKAAFEEIRLKEIKHEPLCNTILFSGENFLWFSSMLKTFEEILKVEYPYEISYEETPSIVGLKAPVVYQPFHTFRLRGDVKLCNYRSLSKTTQPINNYRIRSLMENYDMSDFVDDSFPSWYLLKDITVFELYSEKTNVRVRIDFRNGEFHYFVAGASDNWKEIIGVPLEMDHVVAALIFKSYSDL